MPVGSTAVPGLGAKPIIDVMCGIDLDPISESAALIRDEHHSVAVEILAGMGDNPSQPAYNAAKSSFIATIVARDRDRS